MNVFNKVTLQSLKKNKTRTLVTIIGIILSAAMLTAVTTFISSLQGYMYDVTAATSGEWHGMFNTVSSQNVDTIKNDAQVKSVSVAQSVGYAKLEGCANEYKPYLFVIGADENFVSSMPISIIEGRMPAQTNEIILPNHLKTNGGITHKIGDVLNLELGKRTFDGKTLYQNNEFSGEAESLSADYSKAYTVVGFYERPYFEVTSAPGYTAITKYDESNNDVNCWVFFQMNNPKDTFAFVSAHKDWQGDENTELLMLLGASQYENFNSVLYSLAAILMVLIMFGSVSLIYNAFSISISERTKQFGLLSSVGATKKQISKSVFFEASVLSAIGIPIGIISGIAGIGVTLWCLGDKFASLYAGGGAPADFRVRVNVWAIVIAAVVALITVMISAWVPSRRARKVTAIEAIRQSNDIKAKQKDVHVSKLTYKIFGLSGVLAKKHFKRNRKKYRATIISLFMSIVLFISSSSLCIYLEKSVSGVFQAKDYDISYTCDDAQTVKKTAKRLSEIDGVTSTAIMSAVSAEGSVTDENLSKEYRDNASQVSNSAYIAIVGVDDETFRNYLNECKLDISKYMDKNNPLGVSVKEIGYFNSKQGKMINLHPFDENSAKIDVYVSNTEKEGKLSAEELNAQIEKPAAERSYSEKVSINIGSVQEESATGCSNFTSSGVITVMFSQSVLDEMLKNYSTDETAMACFGAKDHTKVMEKMEETINGMDGVSVDGLDDAAKNDEVRKNLITIIEVFAYGFITLISLIAVANVFNTISTNINLRRREFAMLKSVGMTKGGLNKMMNFECLLYGFKALILGLPVSIGIVYLIYISVDVGYMMSFFIPWQPVVIAVFSVFAVVFTTMMYSMNKVKKDNPIDALRNENL